MSEPIIDTDEVRKLCIRMQTRRGGKDLMFLWSDSAVRIMRLSDGACVGTIVVKDGAPVVVTDEGDCPGRV